MINFLSSFHWTSKKLPYFLFTCLLKHSWMKELFYTWSQPQSLLAIIHIGITSNQKNSSQDAHFKVLGLKKILNIFCSINRLQLFNKPTYNPQYLSNFFLNKNLFDYTDTYEHTFAACNLFLSWRLIFNPLILHVPTNSAFQILCSMNLFHFIGITRKQSFDPT